MGTMVLRAESLPPSPPAKFGKDATRRRHHGSPARQTMSSGKGEAFPGRRPPPPPRTKPARSHNNRCGRAVPAPPGRQSRSQEQHHQMVVKLPVKKLVMEEVTILKRGQQATLPPPPAAGGDYPALYATTRLGPDPEILPKKTRIAHPKPQIYAGSGFFTSPPPSSVPLPTSFFAKKDVASTTDLATSALRCLLRLDLS